MAFGLKIIGRPGESRSSEKKARALQTLQSQHQDFLDQLKRLNDQELVDFLRLDVLGEVLDKRVGQVGRYERGVFQEAFKVLIEEQFDVTSMEICWRAA
ncbi:hypothetical protein DLJ61_10850 [Gordonia terrae]|uniref:Uncharacterized protein n=1 Tax=Gordonia terrae TaxID=2055 RepID=A0AAD0P040_9ACTN|nr:hypothetical protein BCM27_10760 [Gordonia terrae]AWO86737.1 hypothetical protein DLJ61_10850 [Gordonia terrae]